MVGLKTRVQKVNDIWNISMVGPKTIMEGGQSMGQPLTG